MLYRDNETATSIFKMFALLHLFKKIICSSVRIFGITYMSLKVSLQRGLIFVDIKTDTTRGNNHMKYKACLQCNKLTIN
ncbi:hypothetical protein HZS_6591 [Henneguya salminicola]|nr:hypothetical protein HZS_6591 [Henneguya salminicola]